MNPLRARNSDGNTIHNPISDLVEGDPQAQGATYENYHEMERTDSTLSDRRKRARKIIINPFADFAFTAIFFVEARRTECHGAASAMMP